MLIILELWELAVIAEQMAEDLDQDPDQPDQSPIWDMPEGHAVKRKLSAELEILLASLYDGEIDLKNPESVCLDGINSELLLRAVERVGRILHPLHGRFTSCRVSDQHGTLFIKLELSREHY